MLDCMHKEAARKERRREREPWAAAAFYIAEWSTWCIGKRIIRMYCAKECADTLSVGPLTYVPLPIAPHQGVAFTLSGSLQMTARGTSIYDTYNREYMMLVFYFYFADRGDAIFGTILHCSVYSSSTCRTHGTIR